MRADYDSRADALDIELFPFERTERDEVVDDSYCVVTFAGGRPAAVELLSPAAHLDLLNVAATRYGLDGPALKAAAQAALAAPDRAVGLRVAGMAATAG